MIPQIDPPRIIRRCQNFVILTRIYSAFLFHKFWTQNVHFKYVFYLWCVGIWAEVYVNYIVSPECDTCSQARLRKAITLETIVKRVITKANWVILNTFITTLFLSIRCKLNCILLIL